MNKSHSGFKMNAMKLALAICDGLSNSIRFVSLVETTYRKFESISTGNKIDVVNKLNM